MKNIVLLLLTLSILPGCNDDESADQKEAVAPIVIDKTDPAAPVIDLDDASDTGTADDDNITSDRTPTFTITNYKAVTDADNVSVKWFIDGAEQAGETGATFTTSELPDGTYVVTGRFIDVLGNMTESNAIKVVIKEDDLMKIKFVEIGKGFTGINNNTSQNLVITSQENWNNSLNYFSDEAIEEFSEITINFEEYIIVVIITENKPDTGYSVAINKILDSENDINVYSEISNSGNGYTIIVQPFHIVKIPRTSKPIGFE